MSKPAPQRSSRRPRVALALALAASWLPCAGASAYEPSEADRKRLEAGEVLIRRFDVAGSDLPRMRAVGLIGAKPEKVWPFIEKCADYKKYMPRVMESAELSRDGGVIRCRVKVDMPWPFGDLEAITRATHTIEPGKRYRRSWSLESGDYKRNDGVWTFTSYGEGGAQTLGVYELHVEPNISLPAAIQRKASASTLPKLFETLRDLSGAKKSE